MNFLKDFTEALGNEFDKAGELVFIPVIVILSIVVSLAATR